MDSLDSIDPSNATSLTIRPAARPDAQALVGLISQLGYDRPLLAVQHHIENLDFHASTQVVLVALFEETIIAWIEASIERYLQSPPFALITGLVVDQAHRGGNIGKLLCKEVERWATERGVDTVRVTSRSTRERAHQFYLRDGYRQTKTSLVFEKVLGKIPAKAAHNQ
jgi:GNAT superfamily N-acetyltransferase